MKTKLSTPKKNKYEQPKHSFECTLHDHNITGTIQVYPDSYQYIRLFFARRMHIFIPRQFIARVNITKHHNQVTLEVIYQESRIDSADYIVVDKDASIDELLVNGKLVVRRAMKNTKDLLGFEKPHLKDILTVSDMTWKNMNMLRDQLALWNIIADVPILYQLAPSQFASRNERDATRSLSGYLHQLDVALYYWLLLSKLEYGSDHCVLIEFGEDVAVIPQNMVDQAKYFQEGDLWHSIQEYSGQMTLDQVKLVKERMNSKSKAIGDLFCQCYLTKQKLPKGVTLSYVLTSSSAVEHSSDWNDESEKVQSEEFFSQLQPSMAGYSESEWKAFRATSFAEYKPIVKFNPSVSPDLLKRQVIDLIREISEGREIEFCESVRHCLYGFMKDRVIEYRDSRRLSDKMFTYQMLQDQMKRLQDPITLMIAMKQQIEKLETDLDSEVTKRRDLERQLKQTNQLEETEEDDNVDE